MGGRPICGLRRGTGVARVAPVLPRLRPRLVASRVARLRPLLAVASRVACFGTRTPPWWGGSWSLGSGGGPRLHRLSRGPVLRPVADPSLGAQVLDALVLGRAALVRSVGVAELLDRAVAGRVHVGALLLDRLAGWRRVVGIVGTLWFRRRARKGGV